MLKNEYGEYFNIYSYKTEEPADGQEHPYGLKVKDGFWNVAKDRLKLLILFNPLLPRITYCVMTKNILDFILDKLPDCVFKFSERLIQLVIFVAAKLLSVKLS